MKKAITWIIGLFALVCLIVSIRGGMKAALMQEIQKAGMTLMADTSYVSDFEAKLYEMAYSSPIAPDSIGLWVEATLASGFEVFSTNGENLTPELAVKLRGWPLHSVYEVDLSDSGVTDEIFLSLGRMDWVEWMDLSGTRVTKAIVPELVEQTPSLIKFEARNTNILWEPGLVDQLLEHPTIEDVVFVDRDPLDMRLDQLRETLENKE